MEGLLEWRYAFGGTLLSIARAWNATDTADAKAELADLFINLVDYGVDQGFDAGAGLGWIHHYSYIIRDYAPARTMIEQGCAVALATDFNPGSCPILSVPLVQSIACSQMRLVPDEALVATTLNAAWALGLAAEVGSLAPGKAADFLVLSGDDHRLVPYHGGVDAVAEVWQAGCRVV